MHLQWNSRSVVIMFSSLQQRFFQLPRETFALHERDGSALPAGEPVVAQSGQQVVHPFLRPVKVSHHIHGHVLHAARRRRRGREDHGRRESKQGH